MDKDIFEQENIVPPTQEAPTDVYSDIEGQEPPKYQYKPPNVFMPANKSAVAAEEQARLGAIETGKGYLKSFINAPWEIGSIGREKPLKKPYAINNPPQQMGDVAGKMHQFQLSGGLMAPVLKGLQYTKYAPDVINALEYINKTPLLKNALDVLKTVGQTSLAAAREHPTQSAGKTAEEGLTGGAIQAALNALTARNPAVNALGRAVIGGGLGYTVGTEKGWDPWKSALTGITTMLGLPSGLRQVGILPENMAMKYLSKTTPQAVAKRVAANRAMDTVIRPSEAANNPYMGRVEQDVVFSEKGAQELSEQETARVAEQKGYINKFLDTIFDKTPQAKKAIGDAYKNAYRWNMKPNFMNQLSGNSIVTEAEKKMLADPVYMQKLKGVPRENVMYLDQVGRVMKDMEIAAGRGTDKARLIGDTRRQFQEAIDNSVPEFKNARALAQRAIIRNQISKNLMKGRNQNIDGYQFFTKIINNDDKYKELYDSLHNVPQAQEMLENMKNGWDTLIPSESVRAATKRAETSMDKARADAHGFLVMFKNLFGTSIHDAEAAKFLYSKDWEKYFDDVQKIRNQKERAKKYVELIGKTLGAYTITKEGK